MLNSKAITKIQTILLISIIAIAFFSGIFFIFLNENSESVDPIKIGVLGDIDLMVGQSAFRGALLAAEQINSEGGLLGRKIEIIGADSDSSNYDVAVATSALNKLITLDKVDYIIASDGGIFLTPFVPSWCDLHVRNIFIRLHTPCWLPLIICVKRIPGVS